MKETFEILDDWWTMFWFVMTIVFFGLGVISITKNEDDKALSCYACGIACNARCEVRILQRKLEGRL